jgi:DNA-binding MarR family transcriptional regulator
LNAHAAVVGRVEAALAAAGLPPLAWYDVLWALRRAPRRQLRLSGLAASLTLSRGGLTKLVDRLEAEGLLRRERATEDGRGLYAVLTPAGARTLRAMWPVYAAALQETFVAAIDDEEARVIAEALNRQLA